MRYLLVANGTAPDLDFLKNKLELVDKVIAVDGGMDSLAKIHAEVDIWLGDMDSSTLTVDHTRAKEIIQLARAKDFTDLEYALRVAFEQGAKEVWILGAFGGRVDHFLTNINLLHHYGLKLMMSFMDEQQRICLLPKKAMFKGEKGKIFSIIPTAKLEGLCIKGAEYEVEKLTVEYGSSRCQSNVVISDVLELSYDYGSAYIVFFE